VNKQAEVLRGEVWSYTTVTDTNRLPEGINAPYTIAYVRITEGPLAGRLVPAQLTDLEMREIRVKRAIEARWGDWGEVGVVEKWPLVEIGMSVVGVLRRIRVAGDPERGHIVYGNKFRPTMRGEK